jgi:uncharacterized membrane protein
VVNQTQSTEVRKTGRRAKRVSDAKMLASAGLGLLSLAILVGMNVWRIWHFSTDNHLPSVVRIVVDVLAVGIVIGAFMLRRRDR